MPIFPLNPYDRPELEALFYARPRSMKAALEQPHAVRYLNMVGSLMSEIGPVTITDQLQPFTALEVLDIEHYSAVHFTDSITQLNELHTIILTGNEFAPDGMVIGEHLNQLPSLRALYLDGFFPLTLSSDFAACETIERLWIEECEIENIEHIAALSQLTELSIEPKDLHTLAFLRDLPKLRSLRLFFEDDPPEWLRDMKLETLALRNHQLDALPDFIGEMPSLRTLDLSGTRLDDQIEVLRTRFPGLELTV